MQIALLTNGIYPYVMGGMQRHSYYLAKYLARQKVHIHLFHTNLYEGTTPASGQLEGFSDEELAYITPYFVPFPKKGFLPGHYVRNSRKLSKAYSDILLGIIDSVDFIYAKNYCAWDWLRHHHQEGVTPPVATKLHGYEYFQDALTLRYSYVIPFYRHAAKRNTLPASAVFSYGGKITDIIRDRIGVAPERIIDIPTGISEEWLAEAPNEKQPGDPLRFVFLGRFSRRKGVEEIYQAIDMLDAVTPWEFHFIGPVPEARQLHRDNIVYHGSIRDNQEMQAILRQMDVMVVPSYSEGMPNVIMEGMASGCAVIATDVGAVASQVDQSNGWLLDRPDATLLASGMSEALTMSPSDLQAKKQASIRRVRESFLWDHIASQTLHAIRNIIQSTIPS